MSDPKEHVAPGYPDPRSGHAAAHADDAHAHAGPTFETYLYVFAALCVCTALSFVFNLALGHGLTSATLIMIVAIIKASLVAAIFMHLKFDWGKLYCIILPVCILTVMMVIILSIDVTLAWDAYPESGVPLADDLVKKMIKQE